MLISVHLEILEFLREKRSSKYYARPRTTRRDSQTKTGKRGNRIPPRQKLYHLHRRVTNKMALKVVGTNKVCKSRTDCNRPQIGTLPPTHVTEKMSKHGESFGWEDREQRIEARPPQLKKCRLCAVIKKCEARTAVCHRLLSTAIVS